MKKIILLGIGGVILPAGVLRYGVRSVIETPATEDRLNLLDAVISKDAVDRLISLAQRVDAKIALISSWRSFFSREFLQAFLEHIGLWPYMHRDWMAPMRGLPPRPNKGHDISLWLTKNRVAQRDCVVIDDTDLRLRQTYRFYVIRQVQPIAKIGFSAADYDLAVNVLMARYRKRQLAPVERVLTPETSSA